MEEKAILEKEYRSIGDIPVKSDDSKNEPDTQPEDWNLDSAEKGEGKARSSWPSLPHWVEPVLLVFVFASVLLGTVEQQFIYNRLEQESDYAWLFSSANLSSEIAARNLTIQQVEALTDSVSSGIQAQVASWQIIFSLFRNVPPVFTAMLLLSVTDIIGRKTGMALVCLGDMVYAGASWMTAAFQLPVAWLLLGCGGNGIFGGLSTFMVVATVYVCDVTSHKSRTFRLGLIMAMWNISACTSGLMSGFIIEGLGFEGSYLLILIMEVVSMTGILILPESLPKDVQRQNKKKFGVFDPLVNLKRGFEVFQKKRENPRSRKILLICLLIVPFSSPFVHNAGVSYPTYLLGPPFYFSSNTIGYFLAANEFCNAIGSLLGTGVLAKWMTDASFGIITGISSFCLLFLMGFSAGFGPVFLWIGLGSGLFGMVVLAVYRSIISKIVDVDEQGAAQSLGSALNGLGNLVTAVVINAVLSATAAFYPGTVYLGASVLFIPITALFVYMRILGA